MGDRSPRQKDKIEKQRVRAATSASTNNRRRVVSAPSSGSSFDTELRFRFDQVDVGSEWCLTDISKEDHAALIAFMAEVETKKLKDLIPSRCKGIDVAGDSRNPAAKKRAREQFPDDHDAIHELHIDGPKRLWGLLYDHEFSIIWWDPKHEIFPTKKVYENGI